MPIAERRPTMLALFRRANGSMVAELIARLEAAGYSDISAAQHLVFENLDPGGTRLTVLARRAGLTRQAMTELVDGLRDRGYVELRVDPTDARARLACLTERGRVLVRRAVREIAAIEAEWQRYFADAGLEVRVADVLHTALQAQRDRQS